MSETPCAIEHEMVQSGKFCPGCGAQILKVGRELSTAAPVISPESMTTANHGRHPLANPRHRLAGRALDVLLAMVTLFIGWAIWSLVIWGRGQTPGKQILKMRVMSIDTGKSATWGHMAVREMLLPWAFAIPLGVLNLMGSASYTIGALNPYHTLGVLITLAWELTNDLWIFRGTSRQRLYDVMARTQVINEAVLL